MEKVHGTLTMKIVDNPGDPATGKPYLRLTATQDDGSTTSLAITTNIGEMIGGAAKGARERYEEQRRVSDL